MRKMRKFLWGLFATLSVALFALGAVACGEEAVKGEKGDTGATGPQGIQGETGKSAYQIWLDNGHTGTEEDFLEWLKGGSYNAESLEFQKIDGKEEYRVIGIGTISDLDIVIPQTHKGLPVTEIGDFAFSGEYNAKNKYIKSVAIPDSVTNLGRYAFEDCDSLTEIVIPDGVTSIGEYAFEDCSSLQYNVKDNLKYLGNDNNPYLYLADMVTTDITTAIIDEHCKIIGSYAFYGCNGLTQVVIPDSVTSIGEAAFAYCDSLTEIVIPNSVTSIGSHAFYNCSSLTEIVIPNSVTSIGGYAFYNCGNLTEIVMPDSVTSIGDYAFYNCSSLTEIVIPNSVTSIGYDVFCLCSSLTIYCEAESKPIGWNNGWNNFNRPVVWGYKE